MICGDVMTTNQRCCTRSNTIAEVAKMMRDENVGLIPVVAGDNGKTLVGVITDRDMVLQVLAEEDNGYDTPVEIVMTRDPITCRRDDDINQAFNRMSENQIRRIPIVDEDRKIIGIISQADIATRVEQPNKTADVVEEISKPAHKA